MLDKEFLNEKFTFFVKEMELDDWNINLEFVQHAWKNTGNIKVDIDDF